MTNFFKKLFSTGKFLLSITDDSIQVLKIKGNSKDAEIKAIGEIVLEKGLVENGEIKKQKEVAEKLKALLQKPKGNPITDVKCYICLPDSQVFTSVFYFPETLTEKELKIKILEEIKKNIPINFDEMKYDETRLKFGKNTMVYIVAAKKLVIGKYEEVADLCGLSILSLEPEYLTLLRNIYIQTDIDKGTIIIDNTGAKIKWFILLNDAVVDSDIIEKANFPADIKKTISNLKEKNNISISKAFILDDTDAKTVKVIKDACEIDAKGIKDYKASVFMKKDDILKYKTVSGLALKTIGIDIKIKIDLFNK